MELKEALDEKKKPQQNSRQEYQILKKEKRGKLSKIQHILSLGQKLRL